MAQAIFDHLNNDQKTEVKHLYFQSSQAQPSISGEQLFVYDHLPSGQQLKGDLDLGSFSNLKNINFYSNIRFNILESIDVSKNEKLSKIAIITYSTHSYADTFFTNNGFILQVKDIQLDKIILSYYDGSGKKIWKHLRKQTIIPYRLVEDNKLEQLEAEVANLRQSLAQKDQSIAQKDQTITQKDQTIADLNQKIQQTPTLNQFQELNNIVLSRTDLDFNRLKQEVKNLKLKDVNPYFHEQKNHFEQLISTTKSKAGDGLTAILDLLLQTNKQIIDSENGSSNSYTQGQLQGQLFTCKTLLQTRLTLEELQNLLNKQKELKELEKQSAIL
ncbi:5137_t:CDS:1, partial [Racocetra persica]